MCDYLTRLTLEHPKSYLIVSVYDPGEVLDDVGVTSPELESREKAPEGDAACRLYVSVSFSSGSLAATVKMLEAGLSDCLLKLTLDGRFKKVGMLPEDTVA